MNRTKIRNWELAIPCENPAFQAENILKNDVSPSFDNKAAFAWKAITFITAGHRPADKDAPTIPAWKAELLSLYKWISMRAKKNKQNENS